MIKFKYYKTDSKFRSDVTNNNIDSDDIVFVEDSGILSTHGVNWGLAFRDQGVVPLDDDWAIQAGGTNSGPVILHKFSENNIATIQFPYLYTGDALTLATTNQLPEPDWSETNSSSKNYIKNKPNLSEINEKLGILNHEYVDLGLPSGKLWATMNVGASSITDFGDYYTFGAGTSSGENGNYYQGSDSVVPETYDTAVQVWGEGWYTPTDDDFEELLNNTTQEYIQLSDIWVYKFTSNINGKYFFLPLAGVGSADSNLINADSALYWSSSREQTDLAYCLVSTRMYNPNDGQDYNMLTGGSQNPTLKGSIRPIHAPIQREYYKKSEVNSLIQTISDNIVKVHSSGDITQANTIYSIEDDISLIAGTLTVPENSTLQFDGGSITDGTVVLQNTKLEGDVKWSNVTISGSCANDTLTPQMFGAYPSSTEDETNKIQHTLAFENLARVVNNQNTVSKTIYVSGGHYAVNKKIVIETDCKFYGDGNISVIDLYEGKGGLEFGKTSGLSETLDCTITENVSKFDTKIIVDDSSELNIGDNIIIIDTADGSFNSSRTYYRTCECLKIKAIEDNNIYFDNVIYGDYYVDFGENESTTITPAPANRTVISKFHPNTYIISDIGIYSHAHENDSPQTYYSLQINGFYNSEFNNINVENYGNSVATNISLGLNYKINHCTFRNFTKYTTNCYGLIIGSSQNFNVANSIFRANSHALATGGGSGLIALNNRNFIYDNIYFETSEKFSDNLDEEYDHIDCDVHANSEYYKFLNISAPNTSCDTGGYNVTVEGCKFYQISPSFNMGDFCIRKCEIFGENDNFLMSNLDIKNYNGHNSLMIEDCIIHKKLSIILQDRNLVGNYYDYFILKNNVFHDTLELRDGRINFLSIDNNVFTNGIFAIRTNAPIAANNASIKNNIFQNGLIFLGFGGDKLSEGVVSGNTIILKSPSADIEVQYPLSFYNLKGNVINNVVVSYVEDDRELINASQNSDIQVFDNFFQKGYGSTANAVVRCSELSNVIFQRNKHNSNRFSPINITQYGSGKSKGFSDYNNLFNVESDKLNAFSGDNIIGKVSYVKSDNKLLYAGTKRKSNYITYLSVHYNGHGQTDIIQNTLTYGKSYIVQVSNSGGDLYHLYFSKYGSDDPNFSEDNMLCVLSNMGTRQNYVFNAPDPSVYPYIYARTTANSGAHMFYIYENNIVCEVDGAAYGVTRRGTTAQRPSVYDIYEGFKYWDTDLNKEIIASEINSRDIVYWRESDGAVAGVKRIGTTSERPTGIYKPNGNPANDSSNIYVGFEYYDTTLDTTVVASDISGDTVTWAEASQGVTDYNDLTNKPTIPTIPTTVSSFTNDAGYLTQHQSLTNYYTKTEVDNLFSGVGDGGSVSYVELTSNLNNVVCPVQLSNGEECTVIYNNITSNTYYITVNDQYIAPDPEPLDLECEPGSYCEISYLKLNDNIFVRAL